MSLEPCRTQPNRMLLAHCLSIMHAKLLIDARGRVLLGDTALEQVMSGSR